MTVLSDEVVTAAQAGDHAALRDVWMALSPAVFGYLRAKGVTDPEAVTSDVFVALLPQLAKVTGGARGLRKLALTIAHARMVDEYRARSRAPIALSYEPDDDPRVANSAEHDAEHSLATARVLEILGRLPEDQREVLTLRIVADLSVDQIAEVMGRSSGAVKQLQRRAMIAVRRVLADRGVTL